MFQHRNLIIEICLCIGMLYKINSFSSPVGLTDIYTIRSFDKLSNKQYIFQLLFLGIGFVLNAFSVLLTFLDTPRSFTRTDFCTGSIVASIVTVVSRDFAPTGQCVAEKVLGESEGMSPRDKLLLLECAASSKSPHDLRSALQHFGTQIHVRQASRVYFIFQT